MAKSSMQLLENVVSSPARYARWRDYLEITKPKVVSMLLLTALVGMCLATPTFPSAYVLVVGLLGIGFQSAAAAVFNHVIDRHIDRKMLRTVHRPIAKGRIGTTQAVIFGSALMAIGIALLLLLNTLVALLTFASLVGYALVYTVWLKHATPQNIVIGGLAGAMPPLLGWVAVTGSFQPHALLLVMIIFIWTPPHFWALAIHRRKDYLKAGVPMLPVTHGVEFTKTMILLYTILLLVVGIFPWLLAMSSDVYLLISLTLNLGFVWYACVLKFADKKGWAWQTFTYSIWHIFGTFVALLADHAWYFAK